MLEYVVVPLAVLIALSAALSYRCAFQRIERRLEALERRVAPAPSKELRNRAALNSLWRKMRYAMRPGSDTSMYVSPTELPILRPLIESLLACLDKSDEEE